MSWLTWAAISDAMRVYFVGAAPLLVLCFGFIVLEEMLYHLVMVRFGIGTFKVAAEFVVEVVGDIRAGFKFAVQQWEVFRRAGYSLLTYLSSMAKWLKSGGAGRFRRVMVEMRVREGQASHSDLERALARDSMIDLDDSPVGAGWDGSRAALVDHVRHYG